MENNITPDLRVEPQGHDFHFYITGEIVAPDNYTDLFHVLQSAAPQDVVYLHLNTPGGSLDTTVNIVHGIKETQATVVACADGQVSSGGSIIFFACPAMKVGDYSSFLIHDGSGLVGGKTNEALSLSNHNASRLKRLYNDVYHPYLTKREIRDILKGQDLYLDADDVVKRINKVVKMLEKEEQ